MPSFRRWPLLDSLINKYWDEEIGWATITEWDSQDLVRLESFANAELQRRGEQHDRASDSRVVH
jgi:hypothetical protein